MQRPNRTKVASAAPVVPSETTEKKSKRKTSAATLHDGTAGGRKTRHTAVAVRNSTPEIFKMSGGLPLKSLSHENTSSQQSTSPATRNTQGEYDRASSPTKRLRSSLQADLEPIPS